MPSESELNVVNAAMRAIVLTVDYVGIGTLKAYKGWEWYEFAEYCLDKYPKLEWVQQYKIRKDEWERASNFPHELPKGFCDTCGKKRRGTCNGAKGDKVCKTYKRNPCWEE